MNSSTQRTGTDQLLIGVNQPPNACILSVYSCSAYEKQPIVDVKGLDIFGNSPLCIKKNIDCKCPNCSRTLGAQKFAPHLEKCMGMGRISVRLAASKKYVL